MRLQLFMATPGPLVGGMEKQVAMLANALAQRPQWQVSVIASECYRPLFSGSVLFQPLRLGRSRRNPLLHWALHRAVRAFQPDIVHVHGHKATALAVKASKRFSSICWVATAHGLKKRNRDFVHMDGVIVVSQGIQKQFEGLPTQLIYNGVPEASGSSHSPSKGALCERYGLEVSKPLVLALGRLVKVKGYDKLIPAFAGLSANLLVVGDGEERANLELIATDNVRFAGYQENARMWLSGVDLVVMTSEREGFSLTLVEALLARVPVLSTRVPGAEEILPPTCLIDSTDQSTLHEQLDRVLRALPDVNDQLQPVFDWASKSLTASHAIAQTVSFYKTCRSKAVKG